jgi:prophage regulatory protein
MSVLSEQESSPAFQREGARKRVRAISGHSIVRLKDASEMVGFTAKHLRHLERNGQFPPRVHLGPNAVGWRLMDLEAWIDSRRGRPAPPPANNPG